MQNKLGTNTLFASPSSDNTGNQATKIGLFVRGSKAASRAYVHADEFEKY